MHAPGGRTAYLSELAAGAEVVAVNAAGRQRGATVGRVKIETRPLVRHRWILTSYRSGYTAVGVIVQ